MRSGSEAALSRCSPLVILLADRLDAPPHLIRSREGRKVHAQREFDRAIIKISRATRVTNCMPRVLDIDGVKSRLIADLDPDEWDLPPKPKWMRWRTYNRLVDRFDAYETILDSGCAELVARLLAK